MANDLAKELGREPRLRNSLMAYLREGSERWPDRTLMMTDRSQVTYGEAYRNACALTAFFADDLGLKAKDGMVLSFHNAVECPSVIAAAYYLDIMLILLPDAIGSKTLEQTCRAFPPRAVVCADANRDAFREFCGGSARVLSMEELDEVLAQAACGTRAAPDCPEDRDGDVLLYSSGSTGAPKAILNRTSRFVRNLAHMGQAMGVGPDDVIYAPVSFDHCFGLGGLCCALHNGLTLVTCERFRARTSLELIERARPTVYLGVSTMISREIQECRAHPHDLSSLRVCAIGGAGCGSDVMREYEELSGCTVVQTYGMTECAGGTTCGVLDEPFASRASNVGRPLQGVRLKVDESNGELLVKSESFMYGWVTESGWSEPPLEDGWYRTGDVGRIDAEGHVSVTGRIKDIVIRGGLNIIPREIEDVYSEMDGVVECCVVGYPDADLGERTCLCLIADDAFFDRPPEELRLLARGKIEKCKYPDYVLRFDEMPRLENGKIDKAALRKTVERSVEQGITRVK